MWQACASVKRAAAFVVNQHEVELFGGCRECQRRHETAHEFALARTSGSSDEAMRPVGWQIQIYDFAIAPPDRRSHGVAVPLSLHPFSANIIHRPKPKQRHERNRLRQSSSISQRIFKTSQPKRSLTGCVSADSVCQHGAGPASHPASACVIQKLNAYRAVAGKLVWSLGKNQKRSTRRIGCRIRQNLCSAA